MSANENLVGTPGESANDRDAEHQPLSATLAALLTASGEPAQVTVNLLLARTHSRGIYLVIILLCLPFAVPVSLPGLSTIMGTIVLVLMLRLAAGKPARISGFLGDRTFPAVVQARLLSGSIRVLGWIERVVRPRRSQWLAWPAVHLVNCICIGLLAFLLALPLPAPPFFFSNTVPAYGIMVLAASIMEEDGLAVLAGYALVLVNIVFFALIGEGVLELFWRTLAVVAHLLHGT